MGLALSCLFVTVSDLRLPLIGSIQTLGTFLKTHTQRQQSESEVEQRDAGVDAQLS